MEEGLASRKETGYLGNMANKTSKRVEEAKTRLEDCAEMMRQHIELDH